METKGEKSPIETCDSILLSNRDESPPLELSLGSRAVRIEAVGRRTKDLSMVIDETSVQSVPIRIVVERRERER